VSQELLGVPTTGGGVPGQGVVVKGVKEVKKAFPTAWNVQKRRKKQPVSSTY
jgi:hypothetical protein